jgi:hypothetical protein
MKVFRSILLMLILLSLPVLACSMGGGEETPAATVAATEASEEVEVTQVTAPEATATTAAPEATATTAAPEATATTEAPEATATTETVDANLGETYSDEAAGVSLQYPTGWATSGFGGFLIFASDQELIDDNENIDEGALAVVIAGDRTELTIESDDPVEVLQSFLDDFDFTDDMEITSGPTATTVNGQEAATAEITGTSDSGIPLVATATAILAGERVAVIFTATPQEGAEAYTPLLAAMVQTVEVTEPVVTGPEVQGTLVYGDSTTGAVTADATSAWSFVGFEGETVNITVEPSTTEFDLTVDVLDETGASILDGGPLDASFGTEEIVDLAIPATGEYVIVVAGFGGATGEFTLTLNQAGGTTTPPPTEGTVLLSEAGSVGANETQEYDVTGLQPGDELVVVVTPDGEMDAVITLLDAQGNELDEVDLSFGEETLNYTATAGGDFVVSVSEYSGQAGSYTITISIGGTGTTGTTEPPTDAGSQIQAADSLEANDEHAFPFTASGPTTVSIVVTPIGELDVVVQVWTDEEEDVQLEQVDASFGVETVEFQVEDAGDYYFLVTGFEGAAGDYEVTLTGAPEITFEITYGDEVSGLVPDNGQIDFYFFGSAGDIFTVNVTSDENLDAVVEVINFDSGDVEADVDDAFSGGTEELTFTLATEGLYIIRVRGFAGGAGTFSLLLE